MSKKHQRKSVSGSAALTIPELEQSKAAVLNTLASPHSRRSYGYAIESFIVWYCGEPRLGFNRSVVVRYRSFLESLSLSAATINLHLTAIRRLADEATESGWLSPELVTGIRRVKGVKRLGRKISNWLTGNQAQELLNAVSQNTLQGRRDGAMLGLLLGCGLRRSEVVGLRLDQLQLRESHWVIVDLVGKGGRIINHGEFAIHGFRNRDLRAIFFPQTTDDKQQRRRHSAWISRKLRLLRAHALITKIVGTHRYQLTSGGRRIIVAILSALRSTVAQLTPVTAQLTGVAA